MKKQWYLAFCLIAIFLLGIVGCSQDVKPTEQPQTTPGAETTPSAESILLKLNTFEPKQSGIPETDGKDIWEWWAEEVEKRTGGRVEVDVYYSESLVKDTDALGALDSGICDVVQHSSGRIPNRFPIGNALITGSPLAYIGKYNDLGLKERMEWQVRVLNELQTAGLLKEFDGFKVIFWSPVEPSILFFRNKKVTTLEELEGMRIRVNIAAQKLVVEKLGATPVAIDTSELYSSVERGLVDGVAITSVPLETWKLGELVKYGVDYGVGGGMMVGLMKEERWNSLPEDIRTVMDELNAELQNAWVCWQAQRGEQARKKFVEGGGEIYKLSAEEAARWDQRVTEALDLTLAELESMDLPVKKVLEVVETVEAR
jgi:TRAP-type C4-dicarboxylate transport system substrate-binding protein